MKTTIRHTSGKTWICETVEDWHNFHNDPLYDEDNDKDFTFDGMTWRDYYKTVVEPIQMANAPELEGEFEDE